jgi:hypothetical protein
MEYFNRIISIGQDCGVAGSLREKLYKDSSYPFDWNVTNLKFIKESFNSKFKNFETIFDECITSGSGSLKFKNDIYFYHDDKKVNENLKKKYLRRTVRLNNLLNQNKKILFIRKCKNDTIKDVIELKEIIKKNYPNLKFKILLLNNIKEETILDEYIIHKYKEIDCFLYYNNNNDIYTHRNKKKAYDCVFKELNEFKSEKFIQPVNRDISEIN